MRLQDSRPDFPEFVNNFWGSSPEASFSIITTRIKDALSTLNELIQFYHEKVNLEKDHSKRLERLSSKFPLGTHETGSMKKSLDKLHIENQFMIDCNTKFIKSVSESNLEKLEQFHSLYVKKVDKLKHHMHKVILKRASALKDLHHYKDKYQEECRAIKSLKLSLQTTWGKELEKNESKFQKLTSSIKQTAKHYQYAISVYKDINEIYKRDWTISINDFYKLEIERIQVMKINCFTYCNNIATLCVDLDQSVDLARSTFALVQPQMDIQEFSDNYGTGNKVYDDPPFVDYMTGCDEPTIGYKLSALHNPDHNEILSRTYSTYSSSSHKTTGTIPSSAHTDQYNDDNESRVPQYSPTKATPADYHHEMTPTPKAKLYNSNAPLSKDLPPISNGHHETTPTPRTKLFTTTPAKDLPPISNGHLEMTPTPRANIFNNNSPHKMLAPPTVSPSSLPSPSSKLSPYKHHQTPSRKPPIDLVSHKTHSTVSSNPENDLFSTKEDRLTNSQGSSNYSSDRNWASPRRREKQLQEMQDQITRRATNEFNKRRQHAHAEDAPKPQTKVPIMKDFSIDFIAKALEDLNSGGDGDVNQFRRSVRSNGSSPVKPRPKSDYIDDHDEVAQRYDSINFSRPKSMIDVVEKPKYETQQQQQQQQQQEQQQQQQQQQQQHAPPTDLYKYRGLPKSPKFSKPHTPFMLQPKITPVNQKPYLSKATARYSFKPQEEGELYFRKGWQMYIIHKQEDNWFVCELGPNCEQYNGQIGLVPGNYIIEQ
ncbi:HOF1 [Candida theae]|uniref:HOF1 n=1 Tax=Candida theae TaxID=1198502 RepID=A0AAD5BFN1_9ASCO|nr:HOF1 [Candida theae]KAI5959357.1 HOF1 [Candida theae]